MSKVFETVLWRSVLSLAAVTGLVTANLVAVSAQQPGVAKTICVLGASGNVGNGIVRELLAAGHRVIAVSRSAENLDAIRERFAGAAQLETLQGGVGTDEQGAQLRDAVMSRFGKLDGVVASLSSPEWNGSMQLLDTSAQTLKRAFDDNFMAHFIAAKSLVPTLAPGATYVSISGGLADIIVPGRGHLSLTQAAQRTLFEVLAAETKGSGVHVRMLGLYSLIATESNREVAQPDWVTDQQVGQRVLELIVQPEAFPEPIQSLGAERYQ
jgi:NAD(P)-dependent dehydrogenase (short-subunit alcohol dehydrogenase family)